MIRFVTMFVLVVVAGSSLAVGATTPRIILPISHEPNFTHIFYSEIPKHVQMVVRMSTKDVVDTLYEKHPGLMGELLQLRLQDEHPIKSRGVYFRRMEFFLADLNAQTEHGECGQKIAIWFNTQGKISGVYGSSAACPV
jgi:hypothetical protein